MLYGDWHQGSIDGDVALVAVVVLGGDAVSVVVGLVAVVWRTCCWII